ncbi:MAG: fluoride efflux transporter FluC [Acidimicrobiales bacterium]
MRFRGRPGWLAAGAIAAGGAAGATLRWAVLSVVETGRFPWTMLAINVAGSVLLGVLVAQEWTHPRARLLLHDLGGIGFCGGLTTFSTFNVEVVQLIRDGHAVTAGIYAVASVAGAIAGVMGGAGALRGLRALTLPLEERP